MAYDRLLQSNACKQLLHWHTVVRHYHRSVKCQPRNDVTSHWQKQQNLRKNIPMLHNNYKHIRVSKNITHAVLSKTPCNNTRVNGKK